MKLINRKDDRKQGKDNTNAYLLQHSEHEWVDQNGNEDEEGMKGQMRYLEIMRRLQEMSLFPTVYYNNNSHRHN